MHNITDIQAITFPSVNSENSLLTIFESNKKVPFYIKRIFTINTFEPTTRGHHAHKECSQLLIVLNGECKIICDDGKQKNEFILKQPSKGLLIPSTIWAKQEYQKNTILMVITDQYYDEEDYIRDYNDFLKFRGIL